MAAPKNQLGDKSFLVRFLLSLIPADEALYMEGYLEEMRRRVESEKGPISARRWLVRQILRSLPGFFSHFVAWKLSMLKATLVITLRNILRHRTFFLIKVFGLAAGIGCGVVIILYVANELTYDAYHPDSGLVYRVVGRQITRVGESWSATSPGPLAPLIRRELPQVEAAARIILPPENAEHVLVVRGDNRYFENRVFFVDPEIFRILRFRFILGNPETALSGPRSVVLTETTARKYFGVLPPLGSLLRVEIDYDTGSAVVEDFQVAGIVGDVPANTHWKYDILVSMSTMATYLPNMDEDWLEYHLKYTYLKLAAGTDRADVDRQLSRYAGIVKTAYEQRFNRPLQLQEYFLQPIRSIHLHSGYYNEFEAPGSPYYISIYSIAALLILLIGVMNYVNLSASLSVTRTREVGIRKVTGSHRRDLVFQFLSESYILTFLAFLLGLVFAALLLNSFNAMAGSQISLGEMGRPAVLLALAGLFLFVGLAAGGYPALVLSLFKPAAMLRDQPAPNRGGAAVQRVLVLGQFVISIFLVVCTLVVFRQLGFMKGRSLGFEREQKLILDIKSNQAHFRRDYEAIKSDLLRSPAIIGATASSSVPGVEIISGYYLWRGGVSNTDRPAGRLKVLTIDPDFLGVYGIQMIAGRGFQEDSPSDVQNAYLVNEAGAGLLGAAKPGDILGERFGAHYHRRTKSVVGVTANFYFQGMKNKAEPFILDIESSLMRYLTLSLAPGRIREAVAFVEKTWAAHFPGVPFEFSFLDEMFDRVYRYEDRMGKLLGIITTLGVSIAFLGLFGLVSFTTRLRRKEIAVRKIIGASTASLVLQMARRFVALVLLAGVLAVPAAWMAVNIWLRDYAHRIKPGIFVFAFALLTAAAIAMSAVLFQGYRAHRDNPADALRFE